MLELAAMLAVKMNISVVLTLTKSANTLFNCCTTDLLTLVGALKTSVLVVEVYVR